MLTESFHLKAFIKLSLSDKSHRKAASELRGSEAPLD